MTHIKKAWKLVNFNKTTLLIFETLYRLFGLAVLFPFAYRMLYFAVQLTGNEYIKNSDIIDFMYRPSTILIGVFLFLIFGLYVTFEIIALALIFHNSHHKQKIGLQTLLITSFKKFKTVLVKYHLSIIFSSMIFLFLVEGLHVVGVASTIELPKLVVDNFSDSGGFDLFIILLVIIASILFIETIFYETQSVVQSKTIKEQLKESRRILKKNRLKIIYEFLLLNGIINLVFYTLYLVIIGVVGLFLVTFQETNIAYPYVLTILYSVYVVIVFFASVVLIPLNFSWINVIYYEQVVVHNQPVLIETKRIMKNKLFTTKTFNKIYTGVLIMLGIFSVLFVSSITKAPSQLQILNNPSVIGHRGAGNYAPENTLSSIQLAIDMGVDAVEIDVRFTEEGIPVLMHDANVNRTTDGFSYQEVDRMSLTAIKKLDAGSWYSEEFENEEVPTLLEALNQIGNQVDVYIELKATYPNMVQIVLDTIDESNFNRDIKILSFDKTILRAFKYVDSDIDTVLLLSSFVVDIDELINNEYIDYLGFRYDVLITNREYINTLQRAGKGVYVWTVNDPVKIEEMNSLGVFGIITDEPLVTREILYSDTVKSLYQRLLETLFKRN